jgi:hypothetical protein
MAADELVSAPGEPSRPRRVQDYTPSDEFLETLDPQMLLVYFVETMLRLSEEDEGRFAAEIENDEELREIRGRLIEALERDSAGNSEDGLGLA